MSKRTIFMTIYHYLIMTYNTIEIFDYKINIFKYFMKNWQFLSKKTVDFNQK